MHFAYIDESGDAGRNSNGSKTFTLGCVLVEDRTWPIAFDGLLDLRRQSEAAPRATDTRR